MSSLSTKVQLPDAKFKLQRHDALMTMGSCFADHIGHFFKKNKLNSLVNPLGIVFNPISIAQLLKMASRGDTMTAYDDMIVHHDGLWHSLWHHGMISQVSKENLLKHLDQSLKLTGDYLAEADYLLITFGSAYVYRHLETAEVVANCHKLPAAHFRKELIDATAIIDQLDGLFMYLKALNSKIQIILTVSPVRYIRDGLIENNLSKAQLLTAVHQLVARFAFCHYFPAYEIVIDELRDYRFYNQDMAHPTEQAIAFVMQRFAGHYLSEEVQEQCRLVERFHKSLDHRPLHPASQHYRHFLDQLIQEGNQLVGKYPDLDFREELTMLASRREQAES